MTVTHFYNGDAPDYSNIRFIDFPLYSYPNAYQKALKYINGGWKLQYLESGSQYIKEYIYYSFIDLVKTGRIYQTGYYTLPTCDYTALNPPQFVQLSDTKRKKFAYEILGRILHLLQDMSVPAHAHLDGHWNLSDYGAPCFGAPLCDEHDIFEDFVTLNFAQSWDFYDAIDAGGLVDFNSDNALKYLFYTANQIADAFPSNDVLGDFYLPQGTYPIITDYYNQINYQSPPLNATGVCASKNLVYSIRACASFLLWFCQQTDMLKTLTLNSNYASHLQIRNPANTGLYQWKPLPYSIDFSNTITVDLMADPWPVGHVWAEWQQRNKEGYGIGYNQEFEWRNASASVTSTFTAFYDPLFSLSLSPVIYEGQSSSGFYKNLTNNEVASVFQLRKDYAYTIQACAPTGYNFAYWSDGNLDNPRDFRINSNNSGLYAVFKSSLKSSNSNSFVNNSARKFIRTNDGKLHCVYESMGKVWYEMSNDNGTTWVIKNFGTPLSSSNSKSPSVAVVGNWHSILVAFQEERLDGFFNIKIVHYNYNTDVVLDEVIANDPSSCNQVNSFNFDAQPVIYYHSNYNEALRGFIILWRDGAGTEYTPGGLYYRYGTLLMTGSLPDYKPHFIEFLDSGCNYLEGTNETSNYPSLYGSEYSNQLYFHLAWQQDDQILIVTSNQMRMQ